MYLPFGLLSLSPFPLARHTYFLSYSFSPLCMLFFTHLLPSPSLLPFTVSSSLGHPIFPLPLFYLCSPRQTSHTLPGSHASPKPRFSVHCSSITICLGCCLSLPHSLSLFLSSLSLPPLFNSLPFPSLSLLTVLPLLFPPHVLSVSASHSFFFSASLSPCPFISPFISLFSVCPVHPF